MVQLRPAGRPYGSFTARQKAVQLIYGPSKGRTVHFTDRKQGLRPAQGTVWKAAQKAPREGFPIYFLSCFVILLRQLQRLYTSGSIFQVPPVYNYSTCYTNSMLTRSIHRVRVYAFGVPTRLRVCYTSKTLASQGRRCVSIQTRQSTLIESIVTTIQISIRYYTYFVPLDTTRLYY